MLTFARREPSAVLLAAQLVSLLAYPFLENGDVARALVSLIGIALLSLVVLAVRSSPGLTWIGIILAAPASVLLLIQAATGSDTLLPYSSAFEAVLYFYAAGALIAYMLADHVITRDELYAVGATFTLVAWAFAYTYTVCQAIEPQSFAARGPRLGGVGGPGAGGLVGGVAGPPRPPLTPTYGFVVESVNVSVVLYVPVRSASLAPMCCLKPIDTASLDTGPA